MFGANTWGDKSVDTFVDQQKKKILLGDPYSAGYADRKAITEDERSRVAAREAFGMPSASAAKVTGAAVGPGGLNAQNALGDRLRAAFGPGPTAGQQQLTASTAAAKAGMYAGAFGRPGAGNMVRALRTTGNEGALMDAQMARQSDILRAQEQQAALGQYAQLGSAMRAGDAATADEANKIAMANAGFQTQADLANQGAALSWQQMNDAQKRALLGFDIDSNQAEWNNRLGRSTSEYDAFSAQRAQSRAQSQAQDAKAAAGIDFVTKFMTLGIGGK